ncbi:AfsR/SARP family transcriptional regulator [Streptomyces sp. CB03238]|uniref:AfsR/SARP family transcriptional regulator n=1 Tax=Streptomyces sp. CB03238 TaxID=1907777 RepID=UPI0015C4252D|nr:AfsR/SARP family transcriptional regulator [Streptomyces sp. CB03238]
MGTAHVQFQVLGPVEITKGICPITPRPAKIRSLLALLCVKSGTVVPRDFIINALWSGNPPRTARTALQVYVSKLRKHLEAHAGLAARLVSRPPGYVLELETSELDLLAFELQVSLAKSTAAAGRTNEALEYWRTACDLWRGPALADLRGLPAFENFARHLDEKRIDALEQRIAMELQLGRHAGIISELRGLVAEYPLWEDVHSQLMLSLYRSGRVSESLHTYHKVRDALVRELGLEPGARIKRLHQSILVRDPDLDAAPALSRAG